jgi:hypothetical protein
VESLLPLLQSGDHGAAAAAAAAADDDDDDDDDHWVAAGWWLWVWNYVAVGCSRAFCSYCFADYTGMMVCFCGMMVCFCLLKIIKRIFF